MPCTAVAHSALRQADEAKQLYLEAIHKAVDDDPHLAAQCSKNLGSELEQAGDHSEARRNYERAISLSPDLMEAHMALAMSNKDAGNLESALHHFNCVVRAVDEAAITLAARGRRLEIYFRLGMSEKAFDDILVLLPHSERYHWILGWCARLVCNYARSDDASVLRALDFWNAFLRVRPDDRRARRERLLCLAYAKMRGKAARGR